MESQCQILNEDGETGINDQQIHAPKTEINEQQVHVPTTEINEQQVQAPNLSHSNIMNRYRKLCEKTTKSEAELEKKLPLTVPDSCLNSEAEETKADVRKSVGVLGVTSKESSEKFKTEVPQPSISEFAVPVSVISDTIRQLEGE